MVDGSAIDSTGGGVHAPVDESGRMRSPGPDNTLAALVVAGIKGLAYLRDPHRDLGDLERHLRGAVSGPRAESGPAAAAVRTACSFLACGSVNDAYFALLAARDLLHKSPPD